VTITPSCDGTVTAHRDRWQGSLPTVTIAKAPANIPGTGLRAALERMLRKSTDASITPTEIVALIYMTLYCNDIFGLTSRRSEG